MSVKVYLAGPMSGLPSHNYPAFNQAAAALRSLGFEVVSPAEFCAPFGTDRPWAFYMRVGIRAMLECDAVAVLPKWEWSRGATIEVELANQLGMRVWTVEELTGGACPS